ncbi:MAG: DUF4340 domain-containing protein, partial [Kiritimatiellae bacterium]|nr:DUF4340 domain-containing protein [Kiritimatiellia bacterium]
MTNKNLVILAAAAAVLGGAAYYCNSGRKIKSSNLNGKPVLAAFDVSEVAKVEVGGSKKLTLAATDGGWVIDSLYGYPADVTKIRENLLKLKDLTVGQTARGRKIENGTLVELKDAKGKVLASATLGEQHMSKPRGQAAQFGGGGYPDGRYMKFGDGVVLVKDALEAFDGDPKKWCEGRICSVPSADVKAVSYTKDGKTLTYTFTIAGGTTDHPAYNMFMDAAKTLNSCGFDITVITDVSALTKLATGQLADWAAAW